MPDLHVLYSIGHSNIEGQDFVNALEMYRIPLLADIRSRPRSHWHPQFDQLALEHLLREAGIEYLYLGEELGGRPDDPKVYRGDGLVDYQARRKSRGFQMGIERILAEIHRRSLAIMCAEEDPLSCHRFLLVCPALVEHGVEVLHIRGSKVLESQQDAEDRLLQLHHFGDVTSGSLFGNDRAAALDAAYAAQAEKCAFRADPRTVEYWY